jgi:DNA polymerase I
MPSGTVPLDSVSPESASVPESVSMTAEAPAPALPFPGRYAIVADRTGLEELADALRAAGRFAFDVETTTEDPWTAGCVGVSISPRPGEGYYLPLGHDGEGPACVAGEFATVLGPLFADPSLPKVAHNAKYDLAVLERMGIEVRGLTFDTMLAEFLLNPAGYNLGLKNLAWARLGVEMTPIHELVGTGKSAISMAAVPVDRAAPYAAADADVTLRLADLLAPELKAKALWPLFTHVEMPLIRVLMGMERAGIGLDADYLRVLAVDMKARLGDLERQIQDLVGHAFNIGSTEQLSDALFISLGLP